MTDEPTAFEKITQSLPNHTGEPWSPERTRADFSSLLARQASGGPRSHRRSHEQNGALEHSGLCPVEQIAARAGIDPHDADEGWAMNGSPVMQALALARIEQEPTAFGKWCIQRNVRSLPAVPAHVAAFIRDCEPIAPIEQIWEAVQEVSQLHLTNGLADPTAGGVVAETMNGISKIPRPRSWPKDLWPRFYELPHDLQLVAKREKERDYQICLARTNYKKFIEKFPAEHEALEDGIQQNTAA